MKHEAQQFEMPVVPTLRDKAVFEEAVRHLPLPRAIALRDQAEAELARVFPMLKHDLACIASAGSGSLKRFRTLLSRDPGDPEQPILRGSDRSLLRTLYTLARLVIALETRAAQGGGDAEPLSEPSTLEPVTH